MIRLRTPSRSGGILAGLGLLALGACQDAPTVPHVLQQLAGGEEWVAMTAPPDLPQLETWLPYLDQSTADGRAAAERVRRLEAEAVQAQIDGRLARAGDLSREATRVAVLSLGRAPDAAVLQRSLFAIDRWSDRVRAEVQLDRAPRLAASLGTVGRARTAASAALTAGDTTSAVLHLADAAEQIRDHAPPAVALRVLAHAEARLRAEELSGTATRRALRLLRSARQELVTGDPTRALQRALYALQLAAGNEIQLKESDPTRP